MSLAERPDFPRLFLWQATLLRQAEARLTWSVYSPLQSLIGLSVKLFHF
jgi:hypothetical protein